MSTDLPGLLHHRPHPKTPKWCGYCWFQWPCRTGEQLAEAADWLRRQAAERRPTDENEVSMQLGIEMAADMIEGTYLS